MIRVDTWWYLCKTSWRCLEDLFQNVLKTFWQDVLKMSWGRFEDVLKMSWRCFCKTSWRRLENVLKTYDQDEYIGLDQDILKTSSETVRLRQTYWSWSRRLEDVFWRRRQKTSSRRLQDFFIKTNVCWETFHNCAICCSTTTYQKINGSIVSKDPINSFKKQFPLATMFPLVVTHRWYKTLANFANGCAWFLAKRFFPFM